MLRSRAAGWAVLWAVLILSLIVCSARAADEIELVGTFGYGVPSDLVVADGKVFVSTVAGLLVLDISDPSNPQPISKRDAPQVLGHLVVKGDYAFAQLGYEELRAIDISDPTHPRRVGSPVYAGWMYDLDGDGPYLYAAVARSWVNGLAIIDISVPVSPMQIGWHMMSSYMPLGVYASGGYAYLGCEQGGLKIVHVRDPASPVEVASLEVSGSVNDVWVQGDYAYLAAGNGGLRVIDVSEPTSPFEVGFLDMIGGSGEVVVSGSYAYVAGVQGPVTVVDISDPAHPVKVGSLDVFLAKGIGISGNSVCVGDELFGVLVFDVEDPTAPREVGRYLTWSNLPAVSVEANSACIVDLYSGLKMVDLTDPANPVGLGSYDTPGRPYEVHMRGDLAYVADSYAGLTIVDVSDPYEPQGIGFVETPDFACGVDVAGDMAYVAAYDADIRVIDISDPSSPEEVVGVPVEGNPKRVCVSGDYLYVSGGNSVLSILDISDPASPQLTGTFETGESPSSVAGIDVSGGYAYVTDYWRRLWVLDVSDPAWPREMGKTGHLGHPLAVDVSGYYAYVACEGDGLKIFDVSDPAEPVRVATYALPGHTRDVAVSDGYAYVASFESGLYVFRFTPSKLLLSGRLADRSGGPIPGSTVTLSGALADTSITDRDGRYAFGPLTPGDYTVTPFKPNWTFTPTNRTYTALELDTTDQDFVGSPYSTLQLVGGQRGYVRPLHGETAKLGILSGQACRVRVDIYTIAGERVWTETAGVSANEETTVEWGCRNSAGDIVASGTYLFHISGCGIDEIKKTIVVR